MREILFRGKRTDKGKWVEGDLLHYKSCEMAICKGFSKYGYEATEIIVRDKVIPETVGQYTGLTDKNGRKIFEGDIVKYSTNKVGIINYGTACFSVQDTKSRNNPALDIIFADYSNVEVIGNIYDNPELMEGGGGNGRIHR